MTDRSPWVHTLSPDELDAQWAICRKLDPRLERDARQWWESRSANQLAVLEHGAWQACDKDAYQLARTYGAERYAQSL